MFRGDTPDMGDGHATTEVKLLRRFRELITYFLGSRLSPDLLQSVLENMDVEITLFKGIINWTQSRIILLFNRQTTPGGHTPVDLFPLEQVTLWANCLDDRQPLPQTGGIPVTLLTCHTIRNSILRSPPTRIFQGNPAH